MLRPKMGKADLKALFWDETLIDMEICYENIELHFIIQPYIDERVAYDVILWKSWLSDVSLLIEWKLNRICIKEDDQIKALDAEDGKHRNPHMPWMLSSKFFDRLAKKKSALYLVLLQPTENNEN